MTTFVPTSLSVASKIPALPTTRGAPSTSQYTSPSDVTLPGGGPPAPTPPPTSTFAPLSVASKITLAFVNFPPVTSQLVELWKQHYVALGVTAVAQLDVDQAQQAMARATAAAAWWQSWTGHPNNYPDLGVEPEYQYWQLLETAIEAVVSVAKAADRLHTASVNAGVVGDHQMALAADLSLGDAKYQFTYAAGAAANGPAVNFGRLVKLAADLQAYANEVQYWFAHFTLNLQDLNGLSVEVCQLLVKNAAATMQQLVANAKGISSAEQSALPNYAAHLQSMHDALTAAQDSQNGTLNAIAAAGAKVMPAGWTLDAYIANGDQANMTDQMVMLGSDVIGQSKAAAIVGKMAADKAKEWADAAAKVGLNMIVSATALAQGANAKNLTVDTSQATNSLLERLQEAQAKKNAAKSAYKKAATDQEQADASALLLWSDNETAQLQGQIANEAIGMNDLAQQVLTLTSISAGFNADAKQRLADVNARAKADKVTLEASTLATFATITAEVGGTESQNANTLLQAANAMALTQAALDEAAKHDNFHTDVIPVVQHQMDEITPKLPKPTIVITPKDSSSGVIGLLIAALAAITAVRGG